MATIDIFNDNAFSMVELTAALEDVEYKPQWLGSIGLFQEESRRTSTVWIENRDQVLTLVPVTPRGAPLPQLTVGKRKGRNFESVRVAKGDRINASEIANVRAFGTDTELLQMQEEVTTRQTMIRDDLELTHEHMRLGAIQGKLLDADGSELYNWYDEFGIAEAAELVFNFATLIDGAFREKCAQIIRDMTRAAKGSWTPQTQVYALAGDQFYDALIKNKEVRDTYIGWAAAKDLQVASYWEPFQFGSINWVNYRGTDDGSKVAVAPDKVRFFPVGARGAFLRINTPGEFFDTINLPGKPFYGLTVPDRDRNAWVDVETYSYPLYIATRPGMLRKGRAA